MNTMHEGILEPKKALLALAVAQGMSIPAWARQNQVAKSTAYDWSKEPGFRETVQSWRREALDRAIGMMAKQSARAVKVITRLSERADSESMQLRAAKAILSEQIAVAKFSDLESRIGELAADFQAQTGESTP
jgi:transposase